jgi:hypothetical protein
MPLIGVRRTLLKPKPVVISGSGPVPTWQNSLNSSASAATQTWSVSLGSPAALRFLILSLGGSALATSVTSLTIAPNVGTPVTATRIVIDSTSRSALYQAVLLSDADTATTATITIVYSTNPFGNTPLTLWTVASGNMLSLTATGVGSNNATSTTVAATVNTTAGGFMVAVGRQAAGGTSNFTGSTETFSQRSNIAVGTPTYASADAQGIATNASSAVDVTFSASGAISLVAAAWR